MGQTKLDNANNNFMLLSNTKFIEARVYDDSDDVEVDEPDPGHVGDSVIAEEDIIKEALGYGISLVQNEFEKVQGSESEDEDVEKKTERKSESEYSDSEPEDPSKNS